MLALVKQGPMNETWESLKRINWSQRAIVIPVHPKGDECHDMAVIHMHRVCNQSVKDHVAMSIEASTPQLMPSYDFNAAPLNAVLPFRGSGQLSNLGTADELHHPRGLLLSKASPMMMSVLEPKPLAMYNSPRGLADTDLQVL
jgi:hypothetical protein